MTILIQQTLSIAIDLAATLAEAWESRSLFRYQSDHGIKLRVLWLVLLGAVSPIPAAAQINLDRFFPPVIPIDAQSIVTAEGKFPSWPPDVVCDRPDIAITPAKESGKLSVDVPADAAPGLAWVRIFDSQSASRLVPLLISPVPVTEEAEPNDKRSDASEVSLPTVIGGRLAKSGDSDAYRVSLKSGQQLVASVTANEVLKSPMDAVLQLTDLRGNVLAQVDDVRGLDPQIVYTSQADQDLLIRIFAFPETPDSTVGFAGAASFVYTLDLTTSAFLDHVAIDGPSILAFGYNLPDPCTVIRQESTGTGPPTAWIKNASGWSWLVGTDQNTPQFCFDSQFDGNLPAIVSGHITQPGETQTVSFATTKDTKYRLQVQSKSEGYLLDSKLTVTDSKSGDLLASNDDASRNDYDAAVEFVAKQDARVDVTLADMIDGFGPRHFYRLSIQESQPKCYLSITEDHFVVAADQSLEIPISVTRVAGFDGQVEISAVGLPDSISVQNVISEPKGDTSKSVKLKLTAGNVPSGQALGHGTFQIIGTFLDNNNQPTGVTTTATYALRPSIALENFWWTTPPAPTENTKP